MTTTKSYWKPSKVEDDRIIYLESKKAKHRRMQITQRELDKELEAWKNNDSATVLPNESLD
jgi:hypothetical protein